MEEQKKAAEKAFRDIKAIMERLVKRDNDAYRPRLRDLSASQEYRYATAHEQQKMMDDLLADVMNERAALEISGKFPQVTKAITRCANSRL